MRVFQPWIGPKYETDGLNGLKLLVVGESHYGPEGTEAPEFTRGVVKLWGQERRHRYFTTIAKLVLGRGGSGISNRERADFWTRVAFANYIQSFVADSAKSRARPTELMWEAAQEPFLQTVRETKPDAILATGIELASKLPDIAIPVHAIQHPSQFFKYEKWQDDVQQFLSSARAV